MSAKTTAATHSARNVASEIAYLARALKAPTLAGPWTDWLTGPNRELDS